jgi:hypothetical protein
VDERDDEDWERFLQANYLELGRNPRWWFDQAQLLKKAADVVLEQVKIDNDASVVHVGWIDHIWKYLAGMSVENLLKGIIIAGADPTVRDHPYVCLDGIEGWLRNHRIWTRYVNNSNNLKDLQKRLTSDEENMLKLLEYYVLWIGRYRLATTAEGYIVLDELHAKLSTVLETKVAEFTKKYGESGVFFV